MVVFPRFLINLKSHLFLHLLVTYYYSSIEKTDIRCNPICTFHLLFYFRVTSNSIFPKSSFFYFSRTNNIISLYSGQLRAYSISIIVIGKDIVFVGAINKVIKLITEDIRSWHNFFLKLLVLCKCLF